MIVRDPDLLGGKLAVRGTRFSASFVLACLAEGMSAMKSSRPTGHFLREANSGNHEVASELLDSEHVAA